jgi:uncharacterized protein (DUF697 family)
MGKQILDQFSLLHVAVGVVAYFWGVPLLVAVVVHIVFEIVENTAWGISFINNWLTVWPGGKPYADGVVNQITDTLTFAGGWVAAAWLDKLGVKRGWN